MSLIGRLAPSECRSDQRRPGRSLGDACSTRALPANVECTSTVALLDLLGFPPTTGNARRLALTMRSMGWVGLKSRRLVPERLAHHRVPWLGSTASWNSNLKWGAGHACHASHS